MGRGKTTLKKLSVATDLEEPTIVEEGKIHVKRRRGRPQKQATSEFEGSDETEMQNPEGEIDSDNKITDNGDDSKEENIEHLAANIKKRERDFDEPNEKVNEVEDGSTLSVGIRPQRRRRKNTPHRAADVGVVLESLWSYNKP